MSSMRITNFRGYKDTVNVDFNNLTVFVGKNDIGKSTILEALEIFFSDMKQEKAIVKLDKDDVNKQASAENNLETIISVSFSDIPDEIIIDDTYPTNLTEEYMLNRQSQLEVAKHYSNGGSAKTYIKANHPTNPLCADLLLKKNRDLRSIIQERNIECSNLSTNSIMRKAIWQNYSDDLQIQEIEIDVSKDDAKVIWDKLNTYLPIYSLFQSDRKNSDGDSEVQDPLKVAVSQILKEEEIVATLNLIYNEVQGKLLEVSTRTLDKLREMAPEVANSLNPVIPPLESLKWAEVFKNVSICGDDNIPINKRGSGVKRLILLNFFRAEAERRLGNSNSSDVIYAIEEPETSQHTSNQKLLVDALKLLGRADHTQVILTTHSATIVKQLDYDNLRIINCGEQNERNIQLPTSTILHYPSLNEVNYIAFEEITEEYHNELYAFLEFKQCLGDYRNGRTTFPYVRMIQNGTTVTQNLILASYIRHQIHHPENTHNTKYTQEQLRQSIDEMRVYIHTRAEAEGLWETTLTD